ncbi:MAG: HAD family hydrolase [Clostridiales bacterium]|nr:HAD family hydrolase [Clostridiales bacterium]
MEVGIKTAFADKQLYVSDMDGTLLNSGKEFSDFTKNTINRLSDEGIAFTVATARTQASAVKLLEGLKLSLPVILMNGVVIYDIMTGTCVNKEALPLKSAMEIITTMRKHCVDGFLYTIADGKVCSYFERLSTAAMKEFHDERVEKYYKFFAHTDDFLDVAKQREVIYFTIISEHEKLFDLYLELKDKPGVNAELYRDVYSPTLWYLEVFSSKASKCSAVEFLRRQYGFGNITGFGDNHNDIALFKACDEGYAVSNAAAALKETATGVIGDNDSDGVMRFIAEREGLWRK